MLHFPREALRISEALWPQQTTHQIARRRLTKLITILFEIIAFLIRKPLDHVTVIAENS